MHPPQRLSLFRHSSFLFNLKYFIEIMQMTDTKNNAQANKSWAKQSPAMKYEILKRTTSKSDNFVLEE